MRPETRQALADARASALEAVGLAGLNWAEDRTRALAIERLLMIVGEALVRIRGLEPEALESVSDAHRFIGMQNVLVHGYDALDPARIGEAIRTNIPGMIEEIDRLLGDRLS